MAETDGMSSEAYVRKMRDEWEDRLTPPMTKAEPYIPDSVVEAVQRMALVGPATARAALTAALAEWVKMGMARTATTYWGGKSAGDDPNAFLSIIIRTEAP